ncbi:nucleocapsid protein [Kaisodi virus]|uniref:Nucleoprotein n=5 Tax=Kaisodi virus TaxID=1564120 RepID=A0A384ZKF5_9VIRU|nr:nucleocapsid protein [Kaisodi virus]AWW17497.1 nucleocapsid protein [Kaisodi virus]QLA46858.1 N [Kaisodi virus] [Kaisodi virus]
MDRPPVDFVLELSKEEWNVAEVDQLVELYAYQGFDPAVIQREIIRRAGVRDWKKDVRNMIILNVTRGNKLDKMASKMSDEAKAALQELRKVYDLKDSRPGAKDITLARVANVHGASTCAMLHLVADVLPVTRAHMDTISKGYPVYMMHTSFGGLINMNGLGAQEIVDAHKLYLVEFSKVINRSGGKSTKEIVESFKAPLQSAISSQFLTGQQKTAILTKLGAYDANNKLAEGVTAAARAFRDLLERK